jgi:DNA-binding transcriptional LysR family regulator
VTFERVDVGRGVVHYDVGPADNRHLIDACRAAGFSPLFHIEAHDYPTAMAFVVAGSGVTVMPRLGADNLPSRVPVTGPTPQRSIYALVNTSIEQTPAAWAALHACAARPALMRGRVQPTEISHSRGARPTHCLGVARSATR